ncbi:hypothetical protein Pst134EB_024866 [Puccinia striiformis f. sp. tritici]|nr:hypothetical protein Pst134EB_024866 [Puccinia striiformis f. sp. tritici]
MYIDFDPNKQSLQEFLIFCPRRVHYYPALRNQLDDREAGKEEHSHDRSASLHPKQQAGGGIQNLARCTLKAKPIIPDRSKTFHEKRGIFLSLLNPIQTYTQTHNKNLRAKTIVPLVADAAKSGSSHHAGNHGNSEEDDADDGGSAIEEIHKRYSIECCYERIFPSFPHPIENQQVRSIVSRDDTDLGNCIGELPFLNSDIP